MPQQVGSSTPRAESRLHRLYRHVFEALLLLFLVLAGLEIIFEKAEPVVRRWNAVAAAYDGHENSSPQTVPANQPSACNREPQERIKKAACSCHGSCDKKNQK